MYDDSITTIGAAELLNARLAQAEASLRSTPVVTREDLLATVYSALNFVLSLGNGTTPLLPVAREGPDRRRPQRQLPAPESRCPGHYPPAHRHGERRGNTVQSVRLDAKQPAADHPGSSLHLRIPALRGRVHQQYQVGRLLGNGRLQCRRGRVAAGVGDVSSAR